MSLRRPNCDSIRAKLNLIRAALETFSPPRHQASIRGQSEATIGRRAIGQAQPNSDDGGPAWVKFGRSSQVRPNWAQHCSSSAEQGPSSDVEAAVQQSDGVRWLPSRRSCLTTGVDPISCNTFLSLHRKRPLGRHPEPDVANKDDSAQHVMLVSWFLRFSLRMSSAGFSATSRKAGSNSTEIGAFRLDLISVEFTKRWVNRA